MYLLLRSYFNPPLTGIGLTVAVLDSGIRVASVITEIRLFYEAISPARRRPMMFRAWHAGAFVIAAEYMPWRKGRRLSRCVLNEHQRSLPTAV